MGMAFILMGVAQWVSSNDNLMDVALALALMGVLKNKQLRFKLHQQPYQSKSFICGSFTIGRLWV